MWSCPECGFQTRFFLDLLAHGEKTGHKVVEWQGRKVKGTMIRIVKAI
jgi:hypothetical protein